MGEGKRMNWDEYFLAIAELVSFRSKDRSTKVGAVIVGPDNEIRSTGYNSFVRGIHDNVEERHQRPEKYEWTEHAERNAIYNAARHGAALKGCRIYINWGGYPCADCTRGIIQAGIVEIVMPEIPFGGSRGEGGIDWEKNCGIGGIMLKESGLPVRRLAIYTKDELREFLKASHDK
jgi:dCMP deaminase